MWKADHLKISSIMYMGIGQDRTKKHHCASSARPWGHRYAPPCSQSPPSGVQLGQLGRIYPLVI